MNARTITPERALTAAFLLSVFLLSLSPAGDPDLWMHLSLGREIAGGGLPATEPHVYPAKDLPFLYTSWLFGLIYFGLHQTVGVSGIILLKALVITVAFFVLYRDALQPETDTITALAVTSAVVLSSRYRFVERPDTLLMLFLAFTVFILNRALYRGSTRLLWLLPVLGLLWSNLHSSILLMSVPFLAYLGGSLVHRALLSRNVGPSYPGLGKHSLAHVAAVFAICVVMWLLNPNGIRQVFFPFEIMGEAWHLDITELQPPTWQTAKTPFILAAALVLSFVLALRSISIIHLLLAVPFVMLAFTSLRYQFLLAFIAGPIMARNLSSLFGCHEEQRTRRLGLLALALWIAAYTILGVLNVGPIREEGRRFGLGWDRSGQPEAALSFMDAHAIQGRVLNQFHWGGYLTWRDYPRRRPFIDGRGHLPREVLGKLNRYRSDAHVLDDLQRTYGIDAILIEPTLGRLDVLSIPPGTDMALQHPDWALVYWDDFSLVYVKKSGPFGNVAREQAYRFVHPGNQPAGLWDALRSRSATEGALAEIQRALEQTPSSVAHTLLGTLLLELGRYDEAAAQLARVQPHPLFNHKPFALRAEARARIHLEQYDRAASLIREAAGGSPGAADLYALGVAAALSGDAEGAADHYRSALKEDGSFAPALTRLRALHDGKGRGEESKALREHLLTLPGAALLREGQEALHEGRYDLAFERLDEAARRRPSDPAPRLLLADMSTSLGQLGKALQYQMKALDVDPFSAEAHRQVSVTLSRLQNPGPARSHREAADVFSALAAP